MSDSLRDRGHEVIFCCGGTAQEVLIARGESVIEIPALLHGMDGDRISVLGTLRKNAAAIFDQRRIIEYMVDIFADHRADLLITDFEAFSPRAADVLGLPVISFNHQQVVTETIYSLPARYALERLTASMAIDLIAPRNPRHVLISSFFFPPLKRPSITSIVPPIIRDDVRGVSPTRDEHIVVYSTEREGTGRIVEILSRVEAPFVLYHIEPTQNARAAHLTFKETGEASFLEDLASCRGVIATAGFTLISEALYLGKPLLVLPSPGVFEQTINAHFLVEGQLGDAVIDRPLDVWHVESFLRRTADTEAPPRRTECGNEAAVACIEDVLRTCGRSVSPRASRARADTQGIDRRHVPDVPPAVSAPG